MANNSNNEENALICDALETIGTDNIIVITPHSIIYGSKKRDHLAAILSNALICDEQFRQLVTSTLASTIGYLAGEYSNEKGECDAE